MRKIGSVSITTKDDFENTNTASSAFKVWSNTSPQRGEIVRQFGDRLRELKPSWKIGRRQKPMAIGRSKK